MELSRLLRIETEFGLQVRLHDDAIEHTLEEISALRPGSLEPFRPLPPAGSGHLSRTTARAKTPTPSSLLDLSSLPKDLRFPFCPTARRAAFEDEAVEARLPGVQRASPGRRFSICSVRSSPDSGSTSRGMRLGLPRVGSEVAARRARSRPPDIPAPTTKNSPSSSARYSG